MLSDASPQASRAAFPLIVLCSLMEYNILMGSGVRAVNVSGAIILPATQLVAVGGRPMDQKGVEETEWWGWECLENLDSDFTTCASLWIRPWTLPHECTLLLQAHLQRSLSISNSAWRGSSLLGGKEKSDRRL